MHRRLDAATALGDEPASATDEPAADAATATLVARGRRVPGAARRRRVARRRRIRPPLSAGRRRPAAGPARSSCLEGTSIRSGPPPAALGEFRIVREIGRGGMGVVYEAEQVSLGRRVALKVLPAAGGADAQQLARFQIEAQVMAALHHPHIVPIFAVGCDRGVHYYAMQLIDGCSLADRLRGHGSSRCRFSPREAARLAMQAAEALEHAHGLGVLHRDIKPANLLVEPRDTSGSPTSAWPAGEARRPDGQRRRGRAPCAT